MLIVYLERIIQVLHKNYSRTDFHVLVHIRDLQDLLKAKQNVSLSNGTRRPLISYLRHSCVNRLMPIRKINIISEQVNDK